MILSFMQYTMKRRKDFLMNRGYSVRKFPMAYVALVFLMSVVMREIARSWGEDLFFKLIFGGILTFLVAVAGSVYLLHQNQQTRQVLALFWGSQLLSVILGVCYGLVIRTEINYEGGLMQFGVLLLLVLVSLLLIAVLMRKNEKKIWFSWSILFASVVFGVLVGLIVWGGLSAAL